MAILILSHSVEDFDSWKKHYDADKLRRSAVGLKEIAVGTKQGDPKKVYIIYKGNPGIIDMMLQDKELEEKMKEAGVTSFPELLVIEN